MNLQAALTLAIGLSILGMAGCSNDTSTCNTDPSLACAYGSGWTCSGVAQPEDNHPDLVCSADNGAGQYCCVSSGNSCTYDPSVPCSHGAGYSCNAGDSPPDSADPSLLCSVPTASGGLDLYCCYAYTVVVSTGSCTEDPAVGTGCQAGSYGFSCTGADSPAADFSNLVCSAGVVDSAGDTIYCCTYQ
jgi:hypothetical protein